MNDCGFYMYEEKGKLRISVQGPKRKARSFRRFAFFTRLFLIFYLLASPDRQGHRNSLKPITAGPTHRSALGVVTARVRYAPNCSLTSHRINCEEL